MEMLRDEELEELSHSCSRLDLKAGTNILREKTPGTHIAYLQNGLAKVHKTGPKNTDQILKLILPGYYVGIQTLLTRQTHLYSATTLEPSSICYIDINFFKRMLQVNASFAYELITYISRDELNYFERILSHNQKQVAGRLADTLIYLADEVYKTDAFKLPLTRKDLAALVCSSRETVIRALFELHNSKIITIEHKDITILSRNKLEQISRNG